VATGGGAAAAAAASGEACGWPGSVWIRCRRRGSHFSVALQLLALQKALEQLLLLGR
jgi:hypothetical protein